MSDLESLSLRNNPMRLDELDKLVEFVDKAKELIRLREKLESWNPYNRNFRFSYHEFTDNSMVLSEEVVRELLSRGKNNWLAEIDEKLLKMRTEVFIKDEEVADCDGPYQKTPSPYVTPDTHQKHVLVPENVVSSWPYVPIKARETDSGQKQESPSTEV